MPVAVPVEMAHATELEAGLRVALGIELYKLHPVTGDKGHKGNVVGFGHGVGDGNEMLVLHVFDENAVFALRFFRFQRRQSDAAAADQSAAGAVEDIAAERTNIKLPPEHIG